MRLPEIACFLTDLWLLGGDRGGVDFWNHQRGGDALGREGDGCTLWAESHGVMVFHIEQNGIDTVCTVQ
jgi:hypothetical protein